MHDLVKRGESREKLTHSRKLPKLRRQRHRWQRPEKKFTQNM